MAHAVHKDERIYLRASAEQKERLRAAAALTGESISSFVMRCALREAPAVAEQPNLARLSADASRALVELLMNPPAPTAEFVAGAAAYAQDVEAL